MKPTEQQLKRTSELLIQFQKERTFIISDMLDHPNELEIYPTSKCYKELDDLFSTLITQLLSELPSPEPLDLKAEILKFLSESEVRDFELNRKYWIHKIDKYLNK